MTPPTVTTEPQLCTRCAGTGLIEIHLFGAREIRCNGEHDSGNCDDGIVQVTL